MKLVGKLAEFIQWHGYQRPDDQRPDAQQPGSPPVLYVCRRVSVHGNTTNPELTSLMVNATPAHDQSADCLVYRADAEIDALISQITNTRPDYAVPATLSASASHTILQQIWCVNDATVQGLLSNKLHHVSAFYPLHSWVFPRQASVSNERPFTLLLSDSQLTPLPCHRLFADLAGMDDYGFLQRLQKCFNIRVATGADDASPRSAREFGLYLAGYWYHLRLIEGTWFHADPVSDLDVSVVHDNMCAPVLGITQVNDARITYSNADSSVQTLQHQIDSGQWQALWLMPAPTLAGLMHISDLGRSMPEHSVCFQPVLDPAVFAAISG